MNKQILVLGLIHVYRYITLTTETFVCNFITAIAIYKCLNPQWAACCFLIRKLISFILISLLQYIDKTAIGSFHIIFMLKKE